MFSLFLKFNWNCRTVLQYFCVRSRGHCYGMSRDIDLKQNFFSVFTFPRTAAERAGIFEDDWRRSNDALANLHWSTTDIAKWHRHAIKRLIVLLLYGTWKCFLRSCCIWLQFDSFVMIFSTVTSRRCWGRCCSAQSEYGVYRVHKTLMLVWCHDVWDMTDGEHSTRLLSLTGWQHSHWACVAPLLRHTPSTNQHPRRASSVRVPAIQDLIQITTAGASNS